jgi:purine nucleosidase/non-specific riboncleoside hydrolase
VINRPFIFDTDGGVDDAQALLLLIAHGVAPDIVTTVFGNVGLDQATDNMLATLAVAGANIPVHKGADRPLVQPIIDARYVHGEDGLGGAPRPTVTQQPASSDAVGLLVKTFRDAAARGAKADILLIGPLTNLALALRADPTITAGIGRVTIMGATIHGRGNTTPAAEFNIYADPEAAQAVFSAPLDMLIVPWEPCVSHAMTGEAVDAMFGQLPDNATARFSRQLARHLRNGVIGWWNYDKLRLVDPLAAAVIVDPSIIRITQTASVQVALAPGITRGMTVIDPSSRYGTPRFTLVEEVDAERLHDLYAVSAAYDPQKAYEPT